MRELVLSLFPGTGLLDRGFESAGFCVVRGPDLLWDQRIEDFSCASLRGHAVKLGHSLAQSRPCGCGRSVVTPAGPGTASNGSLPPSGRLVNHLVGHDAAEITQPGIVTVCTCGHAAAGSAPFHGIIAGPPCQNFSDANRRRDTSEGDRLLRETLRIIDESRPEWFLIENVRNVPDVALWPYEVQRLDITDDECGGKQRRLRHIQFGSLQGEVIRPRRTSTRRRVTGRRSARAVLCRPRNKHERHSRRAEAQGVPQLRLASLTKTARHRAIGNGVPYLVALTLAEAVRNRGPATPHDCHCGCGRPINPAVARAATPSCRKRLERQRRTPRRVVTLE